MTVNENPAWADRILSDHWDALAALVGESWMPVAASVGRTGRRKFTELGCGSYGCVIETRQENIVFKLTSDPSEAAFVVAALSMTDWPAGMIRYHRIVELPERHRKRRVFALWREEAGLIGFPLLTYQPGQVTDRYVHDSWRELLSNLNGFKRHAARVRGYIKQSKNAERSIAAIKEEEDFASYYVREGRAYVLRGAQRAAVEIQNCRDIAEVMEHTYASDTIGGAFSFYLDEGILLADVHAHNVGVATRPPDDEYDDWHAVNVITDPGHMVPLDSKWLHVAVPQLE